MPTITIADILKQAIKDKKDDTVMYILYIAEVYAQTAFRCAAERGNLDLIFDIYQKYKHTFTSVDMPREAFKLAIKNNHLHVLEYLLDENIFNRHDLKYSYYSGLPIAVYNAAKNVDNLPVLEYLLSNSACITPDAFIAAASGENQEIIDLLVKHGGDARIATIENYLKETYKSCRGRLTEKQIHEREMARKYLL